MHIGVPIEVIAPHAIQNENEDNARSSKTRTQHWQYTACRSRGHRHTQRRRKRWRNVLLHGRHRVHSRSHCRARKHQRNRDVIRPRGTVHVRHVRVRPRDEVAFTWHDQELASSSRKVCPSEHLEEALSREARHRPAPYVGFEARRSQKIARPAGLKPCQAIATRVRTSRTAPQAVNLEEVAKVGGVFTPPVSKTRSAIRCRLWLELSTPAISGLTGGGSAASDEPKARSESAAPAG